jgi:hypothetical protein
MICTENYCRFLGEAEPACHSHLFPEAGSLTARRPLVVAADQAAYPLRDIFSY